MDSEERHDINALEEVRQIYLNRSVKALEWKSKGGVVLGCFENYTPEEVIIAADILPIRILGTSEYPSLSDSFVKSYNCPHCRSEFHEGLKSTYNFLDGYVSPDTCDSNQRFFNLWQSHVAKPFTFQIGLPRLPDERGVSLFRWHLRRLKAALEKFVDKEVNDESLRRAIEVCNENRCLLKKVYDLRMAEPPLLLGSEAVQIVVSSMVSPKEDSNLLLQRILDEVPKRGAPPRGGPRILICGSPAYNIEYYQIIESCGGNVVADDLSVGSRYFWYEVDSSIKDPLTAIARRYVCEVPAPYMYNEKRFTHLKEMIKRYRVEGVIVHLLKWCTPYMGDYPLIKNKLKELGVPHTRVEDIQTRSSIERNRTQVETFIDMLR